MPDNTSGELRERSQHPTYEGSGQQETRGGFEPARGTAGAGEGVEECYTSQGYPPHPAGPQGIQRVVECDHKHCSDHQRGQHQQERCKQARQQHKAEAEDRVQPAFTEILAVIAQVPDDGGLVIALGAEWTLPFLGLQGHVLVRVVQDGRDEAPQIAATRDGRQEVHVLQHSLARQHLDNPQGKGG